MKLAEKILSLRTARGLSQGDLAEKLEVSRQSVSKWETGQSVPDLDKIIKLADLFGVSVDELVREDAMPAPPKTETQIIYVEKKRSERTPGHFIGIVMTCIGVGMLLMGVLQRNMELLMVGLMLLAGGIPMVIKRRFHWSAPFWMMTAVTLFLNPILAIMMCAFGVWLIYCDNGENEVPASPPEPHIIYVDKPKKTEALEKKELSTGCIISAVLLGTLALTLLAFVDGGSIEDETGVCLAVASIVFAIELLVFRRHPWATVWWTLVGFLPFIIICTVWRIDRSIQALMIVIGLTAAAFGLFLTYRKKP